MKEISLIKHAKGALGLRVFGLGPNLKPTNGLIKLQKLLDNNAFWAKDRTINDLKKCLANSDVVISLWVGKEIVGFGRALTDGIYRGVLWDIVIDQNHQGKGFGTLIVKNLLSSKKIKNTKELSFLEAELITGKTHQIRKHCYELGFPIVGDKKYFFSVSVNRATKFFCIIVSSICIPTVLGSKPILTPSPKIDPLLTQLVTKINNIMRNFLIIF